jgi:NTE family protein
MGADRVIGLMYPLGNKEIKIKSVLDVFWQSIEILERQVFAAKTNQADLLIQPPVAHIGSSRFNRAEECIQIGMDAARQALPRIRELIYQPKIKAPPGIAANQDGQPAHPG